jgi:hypothetical protein
MSTPFLYHASYQSLQPTSSMTDIPTIDLHDVFRDTVQDFVDLLVDPIQILVRTIELVQIVARLWLSNLVHLCGISPSLVLIVIFLVFCLISINIIFHIRLPVDAKYAKPPQVKPVSAFREAFPSISANVNVCEELMCCICYDWIHRVRILSCGHYFCRACIHEWLDENYECCVCRKRVSRPPLAAPGLDNVIASLAFANASRNQKRKQQLRAKRHDVQTFASEFRVYCDC